MTATITKKTPSPADDTLTRHAGNAPPFVGITNEDQICRLSDGSHSSDRSKAVVSDPWPCPLASWTDAQADQDSHVQPNLTHVRHAEWMTLVLIVT
jgi:hypothetical protein